MFIHKFTSALRKALATIALAATVTGTLSLIAPAQAAVIFDNLPTIDASSPSDNLRAPGNALTAQIQVGASNVNINQFGVWGSQTANGNLKFLIFRQSDWSLIYISDAIATNAGSSMWFDSPVFNTLTLLANHNYYMGVTSDQAFNYHYTLYNPAYTSNGLTSAAGFVAGDSGNTENFANPIGIGGGIATGATRIYGPAAPAAVPEPGTLAIFGLGLVGLGLARWRKKA